MTVTIANVSLPQMQGALSAAPDQIAWVVTSNIVATAIMTPLAGWLVSRFGLPADRIDPERHVLPLNGTREGLFSCLFPFVPETKAGARPIVAGKIIT
ncbi:MAG: hypothetical protein JJE42_16995 [Burkholderiales bacterium]|nr:hypothetical protein [Burkholderiales bacterium]